ncbi:receptor-type tyrosine-protein phosphatase F-like [Asterias rubens]|uniref:receptor-type tyrosine-protein phosphatase F-like n=1 Tax=Asterias rubens TaxID=7604 RepID=UPI0014551483|nr:receptor-type tyrosine-protein phosphatase F-like [Asterias rubens]
MTGWTNSSDSLPSTLPDNVKSKIYKVPNATTGSVGVFEWRYGSNTVKTIRMRSTASLVPAFVSRTVNIGDDVALTVTRNTEDITISKSKWKKDNGITMNADILDFNIANASTNDSGIYECHYKHERGKGNQALLRLIVRGCPQHKYDLTDCSNKCPRCLNGGVCSDVDGDCICPPGFGGKICGEVKGPNRFGQKGSLRCDAVGLPHDGSTCKGMLFCLPDPYGCSCAAGYQGLECKTDCHDGTYGANCDQNCHCADSASCDGTTGECDGDCAAGYKGDNCQVQCTSGEFGLNCNQTCHCADVESCNGTTGRCIGDCASGYKGDNCQEQCLLYEYKLSCSTTCTILDPNMIPRRLSVSSYSADDSFTHTLSWEPVICPAKGFSIVNYVYKVLDGRGSEVEPVEIEGTSVNLHLTNCTRYQLEVAARTSKGIGIYSEEIYTTKSTVPNPVASVTVSPTSHNQLAVSWDTPLTDNQSPCHATEYLVTYDLIQLEQCEVASRGIETLTTTNTTLTIERLEAYSTYWVTVTSKNQAGSSTPVSTTMTTKETKPEAPTVIVDSTSTDYIEFAWELPCGRTGGNITEYRYKYKKATDNKFMQTTTTTDTRIRITSLTPCTSYVFQVTALNSIGKGTWSNETRQNTTQKEPLGVRNLSVEPGSQGILVASWEDRGVGHTNNPCLASNYLVTYELINLDQCGEGDQSDGSLSTTDTTITVEGLHPYSTYKISVTSRNEAGDGPTKSKSAITTERSFGIAPTFNSSRVTSTSIRITWNPIPCGSRGVRITGYGVSLSRQNGQSKRDNLQQVPNTSVSAQFDQLFHCTTYIITVTTTRLRGEGTSFSREIETDSIEPLGVKNLSVEPGSQGILVASWKDRGVGHKNKTCLASSYYVTYELINLDQCGEGDQSDGSLNTTDTTTTVEGLHPYSTYKISVTSRNEAGDGPTKSKSATTAERSLGIAPTFNRSEVTASSISITWNPIPCGSRGGSITGYISKLFLKGNIQIQDDVIGESTSVQFDELAPCTNYTIAVTTDGASIGTSFEREETTFTVEPLGVKNLSVEPGSQGILVASWKDRGVGHKNKTCLASSYYVTYELINLDQCGEGDQSDGSLNTTDTTTTVEGLHPYSTYKISVTSRNEAGDGPTKSKSATTAERSLGIAPTFNRSEVTASSISITWNPIPCGSRGGSITGYISKLFLKGNIQIQDDVIGESTSVQFDELAPCTNYTIAVTTDGASIGTSFEREETTYTVAPGRVTVLRANPTPDATQIHVTWLNPNANNCPVSKYKVEYQLTNRDQCDRDVTQNREQWLDGSQSPTTITGLDPHSTYRVYVTPSNSAGAGEEVSVTVNTNNTAPSGPPRDLKFFDVTNQTISFSWKRPVCGQRNGIITQYHYRLIDSEEEVLEEDTTSSTGTEFTGLVPFMSYNLSVSAENQFASGPVASITTRTQEGIPPPPSKVIFSVTRSDRITVAWNAPSPPHGTIISYEIRYWKTGSGNQTSDDTVKITKQLASRGQTKRISSLEGSISYSVQVRAETSVGHGPWSDISTVATDPGEPSQPRSLIATEITQTSITLSWGKPQYPNGKIVHYIVEHRVQARPYDRSFNFYTHSEFRNSKVLATSLNEVISDLEPSTQYEVRVRAVNNANMSGNISQVEVFTELPLDLTPPDKPALIGAESSVTHLTIRLASTNASKYTSSYQIGVKSIAGDSTLTGKISKRSAPEFLHHDNNPSAYVAAELPGRLPEKFVVGDNKTYGGYWNPPLQEDAVYEIYVGAVSRINETKASVVWNDEPLTVEVDGDYSEPSAAGSVVAVILILLVLVIIVLLAAVFLRKWKEGKAVDGHNGVNAASLNPPDYEDIELSNRGCDASADKVSRSSTDHSSGQSASIPGPSAPKSPTKDQSGAGPSTSTKPAIKQKPNVRSRPKSKSAVKGASGSSTTGAVTMTDLARFIKARKSGKINAFQQDFETLPPAPNHPQTVALDDANKKKNRYKNISAYDHSRVVLEPLEGHPHSDYINACYIGGYKYDAKYIACQGPNQTTVNDMWRMVWQERVGKIIMLTNLVENGKDKCEKYWPDVESSTNYGEIFVRNVEEKTSPTFILRTMHLSKSSEPEGEYREVLQYHYITWPDMKPPESSSLLQFIGRVHASETTQHGPTIVHCSAGVGRTGTYIALDAMMEQAQAEGQVDVLSFVRSMRDKRYLMVQTVGQFKFIYEALLESSLSENTAISVDRFSQDLIKLKKRDKKTGTNGMEDQFQMLDTFTASMSDDQCYGGRQPDNADKNRFEDCIPRDSTRPYLMTTGDEGSTNYINATFLEGSRGKHSYLATQAPLPSTMGDIWRLVFDYKSSCIIMLNSTDNDPSIPQYWPEEGSMSFGPLTVELLSEDQRDEDMVVRQFGITYPLRNQKEVQTVCHIQFLQWPKKKDIPSSPSSLLKLIEAVNTWTEEHPDGPLTVHCIDGEGCSGTFCTLITLLDRLEQDGVIDVFQAVKKLRSTRAGMVKTLAQYQLCYQVVKTYLDEASSSTIYENVHR